MKWIRFLICTLLSVILIFLLNTKLGKIPPAGKILDPVKGFMANAETDKTYSSQQLKIPGLRDKVNVYFDERMVPHIFAQNDYDVYLAQGYITSKFRLWQMEMQIIAASGRVSEKLGKDYLDFDRYMRRIGMTTAAENAFKQFNKDTITANAINAYSDGVNAYIKTLSYKTQPLEYKLLDYNPEAWTSINSLYLLKYMSNTLTGYDDDVAYTNLFKMLGKKNFDILFPDHPADVDPVIPSEKIYDFTPVKIDTAQEYFTSPFYEKNTMEQAAENQAGIGSNNWAVGPQKTKNGNPILSNDPHLPLNLPSLWYEVQLNTPTMNVYGVSLPGAPGVIIGFNDSIAWGMTSAERDVRDWYKIIFKSPAKNEYKYANIWLPAQKKIEVIKIRGQKDFIDTVIYTKQGPVVYNNFKKDMQSWENLAMRWKALDASNEFKTFYLLNRAKNFDEYRNALQYLECPAHNFVFACANGDIAITQAGKFPVKWPQQGRFILDGSNPQDEWNAYIPFEQNPFIKNPERGFVSSANQQPTDQTYPYYYTGFGYEYFRNRRINYLLSSMTGITVVDMKKMQLDNYNLAASESLPELLKYIDTTKSDADAKQIYSTLNRWNYMNEPDATAPTYYQYWWNTFTQNLWDEFTDKKSQLVPPSLYATIKVLQNNPDIPYYDIKSTPVKESLGDVINMSFRKMTEWADSVFSSDKNELKWYAFKNTDIMHIAQIAAFSRMKIYNGGYKNIINATSHKNGPSWRMVVELGDTVNAWGVYPGGESGNAGSKYYDNFVTDWANGNYYKLNFFTSETEAKNNSSFQFSLNK